MEKKQSCLHSATCQIEKGPSRPRATKGDCVHCGWPIEMYEDVHYSFYQDTEKNTITFYGLHKECVDDFEIEKGLR